MLAQQAHQVQEAVVVVALTVLQVLAQADPVWSS
jgi:hypothetical protein